MVSQECTKANVVKRSSSESATDSRTAARECGLLISPRSAPGAAIEVARRTALHVVRHDADRT
eukprot:1534235-Prymnesium_polylepis.1